MDLTRTDLNRQCHVSDPGHVGRARRAARELAARAGFDETLEERVAIVATEAAENIARHAGEGDILLRRTARGSIELLSLDSGPGMRDVPGCLVDGVSTAGTSGTGLGAIQRLSDEFDIYSAPGKGTAIYAEFQPNGTRPADGELVVGGVCVPLEGYSACGDGWIYLHEQHLLVVFDGLGHGPRAQEATLAGIEVVPAGPLEPVDLLDRLHDALAGTRGAAAAVIRLDRRAEVLEFAGIGNVAARLVTGSEERRFVSTPGVVGERRRDARLERVAYPPGSVLLVHSDGLTSRWTLDAHRAILRRHPTLIAGVLLREHRRTRDDAAVVVLKEKAGPWSRF